MLFPFLYMLNKSVFKYDFILHVTFHAKFFFFKKNPLLYKLFKAGKVRIDIRFYDDPIKVVSNYLKCLTAVNA